MSWISAGTASVANGTASVSFQNVNLADQGVKPGMSFQVFPDSAQYEIKTVDSATVLTLARPYAGSSNAAAEYDIIPTDGVLAGLAADVSTLIGTYQGIANKQGQGRFDKGTAVQPGIAFADDIDTGLFWKADNDLGLAVGGVEVASIEANGLKILGTLFLNSGIFNSEGSLFKFIKDVTGGVVDAATDYLFESSGTVQVELLGVAGTNTLIAFSDGDHAVDGAINYRHGPRDFEFSIAGVVRHTWTADLARFRTDLSTDQNLTVAGTAFADRYEARTGNLITYDDSVQVNGNLRIERGSGIFETDISGPGSAFTSWIVDRSDSTTAGTRTAVGLAHGGTVLASLSTVGYDGAGGISAVNVRTFAANSSIDILPNSTLTASFGFDGSDADTRLIGLPTAATGTSTRVWRDANGFLRIG